LRQHPWQAIERFPERLKDQHALRQIENRVNAETKNAIEKTTARRIHSGKASA
jgi:hypothetical protein